MVSGVPEPQNPMRDRHLLGVLLMEVNMMELVVSDHTVLIDDDMYPLFDRYVWRIMSIKRKHGQLNYLANYFGTFHRIVLGLEPGDNIIVDHIDGNTLNNTWANLRTCNKAQNQQNRPGLIVKNGKRVTSRFKGVSLGYKGKFIAQIRANNSVYHLGTFISETEAAMAYNEAALVLHGEYAYLNNLDEAYEGW